MADEHLNLFYSYNRDTELIENNLTRAFIVTLSFLSPTMRQTVLSQLLSPQKLDQPPVACEAALRFDDASLALQSHMDPSLARSARRKLLLTLSTEPLAEPSALSRSADLDAGQPYGRLWPRSVPDAWIYQPDGSYCVLIEAKIGTYPLDVAQLSAHLRDWFAVGRGTALESVGLCSRTWTEVLAALRLASDVLELATDQDRTLIGQLVDFIGLYGYRLFRGFEFASMYHPPAYQIPTPKSYIAVAEGFDFAKTRTPPRFALAIVPLN